MQNDDDHVDDKHKVTQTNKDGEEIVIKDPIYDIMTDEELEEATKRLMSIIEADPDEQEHPKS